MFFLIFFPMNIDPFVVVVVVAVILGKKINKHTVNDLYEIKTKKPLILNFYIFFS